MKPRPKSGRGYILYSGAGAPTRATLFVHVHDHVHVLAQAKGPAPAYALYLPMMAIEHTFMNGNPPRLWVSPNLGFLSWRLPARPRSCKYIS